MITLHLAFKKKSKKITISSHMAPQQIGSLIAQTFQIEEKIVGLTNSKGSLIHLQTLAQNLNSFKKELLYIITAQDLNEEEDVAENMMSFASDTGEHASQKPQKRSNRGKVAQQINQPIEGNEQFNKKVNANYNNLDYESDKDHRNGQIPSTSQSFYMGLIGSIQIFQELFLQETDATVVFCFIKEKPRNIVFPYYLYHTDKNACIVYVGKNKVCEFYIQNMNIIPAQIQKFIRSIVKTDTQQVDFHRQSAEKVARPHNKKQSRNRQFVGDEGEIQFNDLALAMANFVKKEEQDEEEEDEQQIQTPLNVNFEAQRDSEENSNDGNNSPQDNIRTKDIRSSLLENLLKLKDDDQISELQFYKMKSQLLENQENFIRKYQMGSRKGFRKDMNKRPQNDHWAFEKSQKKVINSRQAYSMGSAYDQQTRSAQNRRRRNKEKNEEADIKEKQFKDVNRMIQSKYSKKGQQPLNSRDQRRVTKYQIPIIVRKYNNVVEKISTSYPLTQEQEHGINLILELQLKGLISQKESGVYKSSILQEDPQVYPLFMDYFNGKIDQIQLVSSLKSRKNINSEKKQRAEHNMRLLMKHSRQGSYEVLRGLLLENNCHVMTCLEKYRSDKNSELLGERLAKIADFYRRKEMLEDILD